VFDLWLGLVAVGLALAVVFCGYRWRQEVEEILKDHEARLDCIETAPAVAAAIIGERERGTTP